MTRSLRPASAVLVATASVLLAGVGTADAAAFGPFGNARWGISVFGDDAPLTVDVSDDQYCRDGRLVDGGESFTGFSDATSASGTCRTVVAEFSDPQVVGKPAGCETDWRKGTVLSDTTLPVGEKAQPVTVAGRPGTNTRLCIFGLRTDGRWHQNSGGRYLAVGPFKAPKPTFKRLSDGRAQVVCNPPKGAPYLSDPQTKITVRVGRKTFALRGDTLLDKAVRPGDRVTAKCETFSKLSDPGQRGRRGEWGSVKTTRPFVVSAVASARVPVRR
jgi:hypothetical protein